MTSVSSPQLTLNFEPSLPDHFKTLREYIQFRIQDQRLNAAQLAGKMDLSPSILSRKLNQPEADTQRFNLDDLEAYLSATKDAPAIVGYLMAKFMDNAEARQARLLTKFEGLFPQMAEALEQLKQMKAVS